MKKLLLAIWLITSAFTSFAQITNLPAGPTVNAYKQNPFKMYFEWPSGVTIPTPVTAEILTGGDFQKTSIVPTISISGRTITFSMTADQVRQVQKNSHWRILFNGVRLLGNEFKTSSEATIPASTPFVVNLPATGNVKVNTIGDAGAIQAYSDQAKVARDTALAAAARASLISPTITGSKLFTNNVSVGGTLGVTGAGTFSGSVNAAGNVYSSAKHIATGSWDGGAGQLLLGAAGNSGALTMLRGSDGGAGFQMGYTTANSSGDFKIQAIAGNLNLLSSASGQVTVNTAIKAPVHLAGTDTLATKKYVQANQWTGINAVGVGTSLSANFAPNSYTDLACRMLGVANFYNRSIGGSKIIFNGSSAGFSGTTAENTPYDASVSYQTVLMPYLAAPYNCKLVLLEYAFNDVPFFPGALGTITSTDKATFYGAYDFIIKEILNNYPDVKIVLISFPSKYPFGGTSSLASYESALTALSDLSKKWGLAYLNLTEKAGYNTITSVAGQYTSDGVHPYQARSNKLAYILYRFLLGVN